VTTVPASERRTTTEKNGSLSTCATLRTARKRC
jgi:hypothetical protein